LPSDRAESGRATQQGPGDNYRCLDDDCDFTGQPIVVDYYGSDLLVCPRCETEVEER